MLCYAVDAHQHFGVEVKSVVLYPSVDSSGVNTSGIEIDAACSESMKSHLNHSGINTAWWCCYSTVLSLFSVGGSSLLYFPACFVFFVEPFVLISMFLHALIYLIEDK